MSFLISVTDNCSFLMTVSAKMGEIKYDKLLFPKILPHKMVQEFTLSKQFSASVVLPGFDDGLATDNHYRYLVASQRVLKKLDSDLKKMKAKEAVERENGEKDWDELQKRVLKFRQTFMDFNDFVKKNKGKTIRAENRIKELRVLNHMRDMEINSMNEKLAKIKDVKAIMETKIKEHSRYHRFLDEVVQANPSRFSNIDDIPYNYFTLLSANESLMQKHTDNFRDLLNMQRYYAITSEDSIMIILGLKVKHLEMHKRFDEVRQKALVLEEVQSRIYKKIAMLFYDNSSVRIACDHIYKLICLRNQVPQDISLQDYEKKLTYIKKQMHILHLLTGGFGMKSNSQLT